MRLSKSKLLSFRQCAKRLYLEVHRPELQEVGAQTERIFERGNQIGDVAHSIYGPGELIPMVEGVGQALELTQDALRRKPRATLFEATFQHRDVLIRADVLKPNGPGYKLVEVKSSTGVKAPNPDDVAVQVWVARQAGLTLNRYALAHVDTSFVYSGAGQYQGLLKEADIRDEVEPLISEVPKWARAASKVLQGPEPDVEIGAHCTKPFSCPFFDHCAGPSAEYPISQLPRIGAAAVRLQEQGYEDIRDIPEDVLTNPTHVRVWQSVRSGVPLISPELSETLRRLPFPRYYLDFETVQFVVPIWPGTRPYEQIPFQWSCHTHSGSDSLKHAEFLADGKSAPQREFAESLIKVVENHGPILVYGSFEGQIINALIKRFPDIANELVAVRDRLVDLLPMMRQHYYHPSMAGSWSIKAVLPAVVPELSYADLAGVKDGGQAQDAFLEMTQLPSGTPEYSSLREQLLRYCELDTRAMFEVVSRLSGQR